LRTGFGERIVLFMSCPANPTDPRRSVDCPADVLAADDLDLTTLAGRQALGELFRREIVAGNDRSLEWLALRLFMA